MRGEPARGSDDGEGASGGAITGSLFFRALERKVVFLASAWAWDPGFYDDSRRRSANVWSSVRPRSTKAVPGVRRKRPQRRSASCVLGAQRSVSVRDEARSRGEHRGNEGQAGAWAIGLIGRKPWLLPRATPSGALRRGYLYPHKQRRERTASERNGRQIGATWVGWQCRLDCAILFPRGGGRDRCERFGTREHTSWQTRVVESRTSWRTLHRPSRRSRASSELALRTRLQPNPPPRC
jgi:hypothetical protein